MKIVPASLAALALCLAATTCVSGDADARALTAELDRFLQGAAARRVPDGQRLEITVTNIDMAGEIESWRGPGRCDLRTVKDVYPPRIDLRFRQLGANGTPVRAEARRLRDSNYLTHAAPATADHLRHEMALLLDWLQRELPAPAGS